MRKILLEKAKEARENAHAPYSKYKVGCALLSKNGNIYIGANVENASYGGTICAERSAILNMVSHEKNARIETLTVVIDDEVAAPPCALCLQVIAEFADDDCIIHSQTISGISRIYRFKELLPVAFRSFPTK